MTTRTRSRPVYAQISRYADRLRFKGWSVNPTLAGPLRSHEHQLRLVHRTGKAYVGPVLGTPLACWERAVEDLLETPKETP